VINASSNPISLKLPKLASSEVVSALHAEALVITSTPRLATEWKRRFLLECHEDIVATPSIFSWDEWITRHLAPQTELPVPLTRQQELLLWEKVIQQDLKSNLSPHISLKGLSKRASEAYELMKEYGIDVDELSFGGEESEALKRWIGDIHATMKSSAFAERVFMADIPAKLLALLPELKLPKEIILDDFECITPLRQQLLHAIEKKCNLSIHQADSVPATPQLTVCPDETSELDHIAQRTQTVLQQQPSARIAILAPDTYSNSAALRRKLNRTLLPDSQFNPQHEVEAVVTQGTPLSEWPMIQQLLQLLGLAGQKQLTFHDFSLLLFSPWLAGFEEERIERANLDTRLRQQNRHQISLTQLVQSQELERLPVLRSIIGTLLAWERSSRPASQWIKTVHGLLQTIGFVQAGLEHQTERNSVEIRLMNKFRDTLTSLVAVDAVQKSLSWGRFMSLLHTACSETRHAHTASFSNITLLPLSQVAGLRFDHIFLLGMDEQSFPPVAQPQPLLPLSLQRTYKLPMSSGALQFESAKHLWQHLLLAAPSIEISFARQRDEQELRSSPFVKALVENEPVSPPMLENIAPLDSFNDEAMIPLSVDEQPKGGARIIQDQSDCPFRAFVTHRLGIITLGETAPGIEPTTKGSLVHLALEHIWQQLKSQHALQALDDDAQRTLINSAIKHAWKQCRSTPHSEGSQSIERFEAKRMFQLLTQWLELEKARPPFEVVETERRFQLTLPENGKSSFTLKLTADRIDRDESGRKILLDYKTGAKQSMGKWLGERMEQPQLPLYAVAADLATHDAVAFASVRSGNDMGFEGLSGEETEIPGIALCDGKRQRPDDWQQVLEEWRSNLNALAVEFVEGRSDVSPRNSKACTYCTFEALCRVEETGFTIEDEDSE